MHNEYIKELFTEGLGDIFYMKYFSFIQKKVKNRILRNILIFIYQIVYLIFLLFLAFVLFEKSFPL